MQTNLLEGQTSRALVSMSVPISIGMLSTFLFQVIDTYFVGQLGPNALAALSFASTIYFLMVGIFIGLAVGVSVIVGKAAGAGEIVKARKSGILGILVTFILTSVLSGVVIASLEPIFHALGAQANIRPLINEYMVPLMKGIPLLTMGLVAGSVLRATGNVTKPEVVMASAGIVNLVFDYLLIFGKLGFPEMGIKGAAVASVLSWVLVIIGMAILLLKDKLLSIQLREVFAKVGPSMKELFKLASPTVLTQIVGPLTQTYLTFLLALQSAYAVASFGVAGRIEMLLMIGILGVSTAMTPFIAQNMGARETERIEQAIAFGGRASTYLGILVCVILFVSIRSIAGLFSQDPLVVQHTSNYFYIVSLSYVFHGLFIITSSIFNGLQLPVNSLRIMMVRSLMFMVPLTLVGSFWGINGIFIGISASNVLGGLFSAYEMRKEFRRVGSRLADVNVFQEYVKDFRWLLRLNRT